MIEATLLLNDCSISQISNIAPIESAAEDDLVFIDNPKYVGALAKTGAGACICAKKYAAKVPSGVAILQVNDPYSAFAAVSGHLYPAAMAPRPIGMNTGISDQAYVHETALVEDNVTIEPFVVVGANCEIGEGTLICSGVKLADNVKVGRNCVISSNCVVQYALLGDNIILHSGVTIGQDGFGFAMSPKGHRKVPQIGRVLIQDNVEIGANTTIDRGALRDTVVGEGTKIDNQVQIGHNVQIGRHCVIVSQVGISGSSTLEDFVAIGGQSGVNGHLTIGMGSQIAAVSAVHTDVPPGSRWGGVPAGPVKDWFRERLLMKKMVEQESKAK